MNSVKEEVPELRPIRSIVCARGSLPNEFRLQDALVVIHFAFRQSKKKKSNNCAFSVSLRLLYTDSLSRDLHPSIDLLHVPAMPAPLPAPSPSSKTVPPAGPICSGSVPAHRQSPRDRPYWPARSRQEHARRSHGAAFSKDGHTVGIVAVDPTSPYTGGAILGDRIRMQEHFSDPGIYIRSMATRGSLGGLARTTADVTTILDASGRDIVLIETVGVGQDEVDIVRLADVTVVILVPGMGDDVQTIKAGIMEIADIFVINKSDRDGADRVEREILPCNRWPCATTTGPLRSSRPSPAKARV